MNTSSMYVACSMYIQYVSILVSNSNMSITSNDRLLLVVYNGNVDCETVDNSIEDK